MMSLASRCRQGINQTVLDSVKKAKSSARLYSSQNSQLRGSVSTNRKQIGNQPHFSVKKANGTVSEMKGRYLGTVLPKLITFLPLPVYMLTYN